MYDPRNKDMTASKGKDFSKSEDTSHRFGNKDRRADKGMTNETKDNLAPEVDTNMLRIYLSGEY